MYIHVRTHSNWFFLKRLSGLYVLRGCFDYSNWAKISKVSMCADMHQFVGWHEMCVYTDTKINKASMRADMHTCVGWYVLCWYTDSNIYATRSLWDQCVSHASMCTTCMCKTNCIAIKLELSTHFPHYGVATISRLLKIIGLFCKRAISKRLYSAKETKKF